MAEQDLFYTSSRWWIPGGGSTRWGGEATAAGFVVLGLQRARPDVHAVHVCVPRSAVGTVNS